MRTAVRIFLTLAFFAGVMAPAPATAKTAPGVPLPLAGERWFADPLAWKFPADKDTASGTVHVTHALAGAWQDQALAVFAASPPASPASVEAVFTPESAGGDGWCVAGVALVEDAANFWHVALVRAPLENGGHHFVELREMRNGEWGADGTLRTEVNAVAAPGETWRLNRPHRLSLALDAAGVTAEVFLINDTGETLLVRRRLALSNPAVARGRPALRARGFTGVFTEIRSSGAVAESGGGNSAVPPVSNAPKTAGAFYRLARLPGGHWRAVPPARAGEPEPRPVPILGVDHVKFDGHWCEELGFPPHRNVNLARFNGTESAARAAWADETVGRLREWGFNTLGAGSDTGARARGLAHTIALDIGDGFAAEGDEFDIMPNLRRPCTAFPNVFHPLFAARARHIARALCAPAQNDPALVGYFLDNELAWWGADWRAGDRGLLDAVMKKSAAHTAKIALRDFLAARFGNNIDALNSALGTGLNGFDDVLHLTAFPAGTAAGNGTTRRLPTADDVHNAGADAQKSATAAGNFSALARDFLALVAERYFSTLANAIRAEDPNHLVLGARFAGTVSTPEVVWEAAGRHCDIVSFNIYPTADLNRGVVFDDSGTGTPVAERFAALAAVARRPLFVTEWSFPALDSGLPCMHGAGQRFRTQAERARASSLFARTILASSHLVGHSYFMWVDEPALGISKNFPEDSNYGLINEAGEPYPEITAMFAALHRELAAAPGGVVAPPVPGKAAVAPAPFGAAEIVSRAEKLFGRERCVLPSPEIGDSAMLRRISESADANTGFYSAMLHLVSAGGESQWPAAGSVVRVQSGAGGAFTITSSGTGWGENAASRFEVTQRLAPLPMAPPARASFIAELVSIKNTGDVPLRVKAAYFCPRNSGKETPPTTVPNLWGAPQSGCWFSGGAGATSFLGAIAPPVFPAENATDTVRVNFWLSPDGTQHPDARAEFSGLVGLAPGETFVPELSPWVIIVAGTGGASGWNETLAHAEKLFTAR